MASQSKLAKTPKKSASKPKNDALVPVASPETVPDRLQSPTKRVRMGVAASPGDSERKVSAVAVTPAGSTSRRRAPPAKGEDATQGTPRRDLFNAPGAGPVAVTPSRKAAPVEAEPTAKRKLIFGRLVAEIVVSERVKQVYGIVRKLTGSIGGNGSHGPIYGELTMGSMQKMVNLMKEHTGLDTTSRFIDVGSGIGKPNLHVAQDPGVEFSYGIEVEADRWLLGLNCLKGVLDAASEQVAQSADERILHRCMFEHADIRKAETFDPFTHVYMFSIGFPPDLWVDLSEMWNSSSSAYLICYHSPKDIIKSYEFNVELVTQTSTSMHGSKEGHMAYIYKRVPSKPESLQGCDPAFAGAWDRVQSGLEPLREDVTAKVQERMSSGPSTRASRRRKSNNSA